MKRDMKKIIFALLLNLFLFLILVFILDVTGTISMESFLSSFGVSDEDGIKIEDRYLLEREEMQKQWLSLQLKEDEYAQNIESLMSNDQRLQDKEDQLIAFEKQLQEREKKTGEDELAKVRRSERVAEVANQLMNMPPQQAVERIEQQTDDLLVIDILNAINTLSAAQGRRTVVPYYISLMNRERAAVIQAKMANISRLTNENDF
ncbi:MAG: hypothetical protein LBC99_07870 [Spirochaetota bacterium]|jgi:hypothetical protein|nr:hypothetical protein [Spirochaetota bacterium]